MVRRAAPLKRVVIPVVLAGMAGIALTLPVQASALRSMPGRPDPLFGKNGRVVYAEAPYVKREESNRSARNRFAFTPGGKIVVESGLTLSRYLSDGRPDRSFGKNGQLRIIPAPETRLQPTGLAVDSRGRVLVAGTTFAAQKKMFCYHYPYSYTFTSVEWVTVSRFTAGGRPDPSFGQHGSVSTDFGVPPATWEGSPCDASSVSALGLALDSSDRPILEGQVTEGVGLAKNAVPIGFGPGYIARFTTSGAPDPSFARSGFRLTVGSGLASHPVPQRVFPLRSGAILYSGGGYRYGIGRLGSKGNPDRRLGPYGWRELGFLSSSGESYSVSPEHATELTGEITVDGLGRILTLEIDNLMRTPGGRFSRFLPDGSPDQTFGNHGHAIFRLPKEMAVRPNDATLMPIAADRHGRILLAGEQLEDRCPGCDPAPGTPARVVVVLLRLRADGSRDARFGHHGIVTTKFGPDSWAEPFQVAIDPRGGILVGATIKPQLGKQDRIALIRYLP